MALTHPVCTSTPISKKQVRDWRGASQCDHFVQFYRTDDYLIECLAGFLMEGIGTGDNVIVIATSDHRVALENRLRLKGVNLISTTLERKYQAFDAEEMLSRFMRDGHPDRNLFMASVGALVRNVLAGGGRLRAFGEMVALLWLSGDREAAIELEQLWNELSRDHSFTLFCAYPAACIDAKDGGPTLKHVCDAHSCVISLTA